MRAKYLIATLSAAVALAAFHRPQASRAEAAAPSGPPPAPVEVSAAASADFTPTQWVPGGVTRRRDARVAAGEAGRVLGVADVGERVARGDVIARLDDEALRLVVQQSDAALKRIEAQLEFARRQAERLETLTYRSSIAETQLDEARSQRDTLLQDRQQARAMLAEAQRRLREASVRAPFAGTIVERFVEAGEHLAAGAAVARLVDTENLEVRARAPVGLAAKIKAGDSVTLREGAQLERQTIRAVVPVGDLQSRQLEVRIALAAPLWPVGTAVEVGLPTDASRAAVAVPRDALVLRNDGTYVFRVGADSKAERITVETGDARGDLIEIVAGIAAGDVLVVRGAERLADGQAVTIKERS
jgi:RND family efflux transporter MFP subunit